MARPTRSGKDQKKKLDNLLQKFSNKLKIRKLQDSAKRGRVRTKKKVLSNIPVQERSADVNKKARGLSSLGSDYKKQEEKLSKIATKKSAKLNKGKYPKMGTFKSNKTGGGSSNDKSTNNSRLKAGSGRKSIR